MTDPLPAGEHGALPGPAGRVPAARRRDAAGMADRPVIASRSVPEAAPLPGRGAGPAGALEAFENRRAPVLSASAGPRYLGFVTGGTTPAALLGDWTTAVWDQNPVSGSTGPGRRWNARRSAGSVSCSGCPSSTTAPSSAAPPCPNLAGLAVAREWLGERSGVSPAECGRRHSVPSACCPRRHSSVPKALSVLGLGRRSLTRLPTLPGREAVDPRALARILDGNGEPCVVVANAGTVNTGDFDDLRALAALRERYGFWLHVDRAFGAFASLVPSHAALVDGLEEADSLCVDLHKWLNVPYGSAVQFTRRPDPRGPFALARDDDLAGAQR
nr:pyridoxal-dependent decarboxylase [Streptomyces sp. I6]